MKVLFEPAIGYVVLEIKEEPTSKLHISKELRQEVAMNKGFDWEIVAANPGGVYKVGDKVLFRPEAKNQALEIKLPTDEGSKVFFMTTEDLIIGKTL